MTNDYGEAYLRSAGPDRDAIMAAALTRIGWIAESMDEERLERERLGEGGSATVRLLLSFALSIQLELVSARRALGYPESQAAAETTG